MARGGIRLIHGLTKSTLITYFSGMKIDPKYALLHAFFLKFACLVCSKICLYDQKHTLFSNFARFCTPKRCTRIQCLVLKNNPNYVNFWMSLIPPLTFECPPPRAKLPSYLSLKHKSFIFGDFLRQVRALYFLIIQAGGRKCFADFRIFHQIFHTCSFTLNFANTSLVLKA